jgi:hypothetical protein
MRRSLARAPVARIAVASAVALLVTLTPVAISAWGMDVHRYITKRALDGLPAELKPFYAQQREFIGEHSADPDLWRLVDLKGRLGEEDPNHFLDIDALGDPRPFTNVPRDWNAYLAKYGVERAAKVGHLPWRAEEIYDLLVRRFQDLAKNPSGYTADNIRYLSAILAHYVEDAHVPFHAVENYDGQLTNQRGVHSRFETELVLRNLTALKLAPVTIRPIPNMRDFMFETLVTSESLVAAVLDADRAAAAGREFYDDAYFASFFKGANQVVERRMSDATNAVASAIVSAWTAGGKPALPLDKTTAPARIRR